MVPEPQRKRRYVGSYELIKPLAQGGMAKLYLGRHPTGRLAAIKILLERFDQKEKLRRRFFNEARIIASIHHPNIVELYEFGQTERGSAYLVMEYLHGVTLDTYLRRRDQVMVMESLGIMEQVASALAVIHGRGVVHRDLKPSNVMLVESPEAGGVVAKVLDFGIAKQLNSDAGSVELTKTGVILGTPKYMSPEQCRGDRDVDHRTDIYGLGIILYGMLTGAFPFAGKSSGELIGQHLHVPPRPPRASQPRMSAGLEQLVLRCLAKEPDQRYQSMDELVVALRAEMEQIARLDPAVTWPLSRAMSAPPRPATTSYSGSHSGSYPGTPEPVSPVEVLDGAGRTQQMVISSPPAAEDSDADGVGVPPVTSESTSPSVETSPSVVSSGVSVAESVEASDPAMLYTGESVRTGRGRGALWGALALMAMAAAVVVLYQGGYLAMLSPGAPSTGTRPASATGASTASDHQEAETRHRQKADTLDHQQAHTDLDVQASTRAELDKALLPGETSQRDTELHEASTTTTRSTPAEATETASSEESDSASRVQKQSSSRSRSRSRSSRRDKQRDRAKTSKSSSERSNSHDTTKSDDFEKPVF